MVEFDGSVYLLDAPFDEAVEDYANEYKIKRLEELPESQSWANLGDGVPELGSLRIIPELFDYRGKIRVDLIRAAIDEGAQ